MNRNDERCGGPGTSEETCKLCGLKWIRNRLGSWDWEYKDCLDCCIAKQVAEMDNNHD